MLRRCYKAAGSLQLSAGQDAAAEAAIHTMRDIFANVDTDAVLLIDAENAFNSINCKVILYNLKFICPIIATYIINCYATSSRLFIVGGGVGERYFLVRGQLYVTQQLWDHMN